MCRSGSLRDPKRDDSQVSAPGDKPDIPLLAIGVDGPMWPWFKTNGTILG